MVAQGTAILTNSIYGNTNLGIDLNDAGVVNDNTKNSRPLELRHGLPNLLHGLSTFRIKPAFRRVCRQLGRSANLRERAH